MQDAKAQIAAAEPTPEEIHYCRRCALFANHKESDDSVGSLSSAERKIALHRIVACVQGVATQVSQQSVYKRHFNGVLEILQAEQQPGTPPDDDAAEHKAEEEADEAASASASAPAPAPA